jgi:hypothetical protein
VPLPELEVGLIVQYAYLWHRRRTSPTADKDHPACVVATFRRNPVGDAGADDATDERHVIYLPISHTPPQGDDAGIELSDRAKRRAGLDSARQWLLISECNIDTWPCDLRNLPRRPGVFHYGHLPPAEFRRIRDAFVERLRLKKVSQIRRY